MIDSQRQMLLVAFMQACNSTNLPCSWRHPDAPLTFLTPDYYRDLARTLESGGFHLAFFDDRLAMPEYAGSHDASVRAGIRVIRLDPAIVLTIMAGATSRLGLGATFSTTYNSPWHLARMFATLDLMTKGRAAWNVVTSINDAEAQNFGLDVHPDHDTRYDHADEVLEAVLGHWATWAEDALVMDKANNVFADPARVRRLDYAGREVRSRGPFTVPRSPQGHPVLIQAGQSARGASFAARWAEVQFVTNQTVDKGRARYAQAREELLSAGRDPDSCRIAQACYVIVGETDEIATAKRALVERLVEPVDTLVMMGDRINIDPDRIDPDSPLPDALLGSFAQWHKIAGHIEATRKAGLPNPTLRELLALSGRGTISEFPVFCGTPESVADQMEGWFHARACDGFVIAATHAPGAYEDFVRLVVPVLRARGLLPPDYTGETLRENLGLRRPLADDPIPGGAS